MNNCIICRLIDISEIRLKISLETAPNQRPRGVLGIWSPVLSAVGNAFKIQVTYSKIRLFTEHHVSWTVGRYQTNPVKFNQIYAIFIRIQEI